MNQAIEKLIKEVGVVRLSDRKVRLDYSIPITHEDTKIGIIDFKVRYEINSENIYEMIYPKSVIFDRISNIYRVKKKSIYTKMLYRSFFVGYKLKTNSKLKIDNLEFNNIIYQIEISDENWFTKWNRNNILEKILKWK